MFYKIHRFSVFASTKQKKKKIFSVFTPTEVSLPGNCIIPCSSIYRRSVCLRGGTLRFPPLKLPTLKGLPVTPQSHWVLPLSYCACAPGASAFGTLSGRSRLIARPPLILATFVASALLAWKCSQSTFACGLRARRQPPRTRALNVPRRASKRKNQRVLLH